jgi:hypothetical protein
MSSEKSDDWKPIAVSLPARYWISVLAMVDHGVSEVVAPQLEALRKKGVQPKDLPDESKAALMGPVFARGEIVKSLHAAGIVTAEANLQFGTDALMALVRRFENEQGSR